MRLLRLPTVTAVVVMIASTPAMAGLGQGELDAAETDGPAVDAPEVDAPEVDRPSVDVPRPGLDMGTPSNQPPEGSPDWKGPGAEAPSGSPEWAGPRVNEPAVDQPEAEAVPPDKAVRDLLPPEDDGVVHELRETDTPGLE